MHARATRAAAHTRASVDGFALTCVGLWRTRSRARCAEARLSDGVANPGQTNGTPPAGATTTTTASAAAGGAGAGAPDAASLAELKAQNERLIAHNAALTGDLAKARKKDDDEKARLAAEKEEADRKLKEAGDFKALYEKEKAEREAAARQLSTTAPLAERYTAAEARARKSIDDAKAKGDLPAAIVKALDIAIKVDPLEAVEILDSFRREAGGAPRANPATPAPALGAAPQSPAITKRIDDMTEDEVRQFQAAQPDAYKAAVAGPLNGRSVSSPASWVEGKLGR